MSLRAMLSLVCRSPAGRKRILTRRDFQNKRGDFGATGTVQVNLQQVFLHLFVLQQISEHTFQQLQTKKAEY